MTVLIGCLNVFICPSLYTSTVAFLTLVIAFGCIHNFGLGPVFLMGLLFLQQDLSGC